MERIVSEKIDPSHYRADACAIWCFDDRFSGLLQKFIETKGFKHVDLIKVAGGAKGLASPANEAEREYLLNQIAKSVKLHQPPLIILAVHADCGAYAAVFADADEERKFHARELNKAEEIVTASLRQKDESARIEKYFCDFTGLIRV
ncbi:MAG: hypothetical protein HYT42_02365 [Candidatus Sungbacteria bacterium]|nr:hypothetical protein [Candidatus Sungbacteria bacterium]